MTGEVADRELLFEALAVHLGFVPRRALDELEATRRRAADAVAARPLGPMLVEAEVLSADHCAVLESLVDELVERYGDVRRCLDELSAFGRLRAELERRRGGGPRDANPSNNPTLPSIPINGERPGPGAAVGDADDSFLPPAGDVPDAEGGPLEPRRVDWSLGASTSRGARFQVVRPHAQGGIGKVSVAFDTELQREVALKQIKPERADDADSRARFLLEAEITGRLEHPGIVPVYGLGLDDDGRPFYAMRFVRGTSLDAAINAFHEADQDPRRDPRERSMAMRHLLDRFVDVCQTVAYAHSRGVLHRDLKPANVLLGPFNESLVVDWGLAKVLARGAGGPIGLAPDGMGAVPPSDQPDDAPRAVGPSAREAPGAQPGSSEPPLGCSSSTETVAGTAFGTPAYMSPEQAEGRTDRIGPASDVYSLGAMLYTLIAGRPPFDYVWCDVTAMLARVRMGGFQRPRKVNPRAPRALEAICLKAMANRPGDRYASPTELAAEIERWLADEPVHADREPVTARLGRWSRRHRTTVAVAAALLVTAVAALSAGMVLLGREQRETEWQRRLAMERAEVLRRRDAISRVNLAYREYQDDNVARGDQLLDAFPVDLKGWEWSYARRLGHAELRSWTPSSRSLDVWSVAFSPDGKRLAAGTGPWYNAGDADTGELVVRGLHSGAEVFAVRRLTGAVQAVAYAPDGRSLAAANGFTGPHPGAVLRMLDAGTGRELWRADEPGMQILGLAFAPDGRSIAAGCGHFNDYESIGYVRIRDARTGASIGPAIDGPFGGVLAVAMAPDGRTLALSGRDVVDLRDLSNPRRPLLRRLDGHLNFVYAVAISPDSRLVASGGWDKVIRIRELATGRLVETLPGHRGFVRGLAFSPDGRHLVSASEDRSVRRWDLDSTEGSTFHGHTGFVHALAIGPDGATAASGSQDGTVKVWPASAPDAQVTFRNSAGWVGAIAFAPDGRSVATAHFGNVRIWDPRTGEERHRIPSRRGMLGDIALAYSPDGSTLAASGSDDAVILWETAGWTRRGELAAPRVKDAAFSPDGSAIVTAGDDGVVRLWDASHGELIHHWPGSGHGDHAVAFARDGTRIAAGGEDKVVRVWDARKGVPTHVFTGHRNGIRDLAFSPDGRRLATVGGDYRGPEPDEIRIWDLALGREVGPRLQGHTGVVHAVAYFPDGHRLATASDDRTIKLWDPRAGENVLTLRGHTSGVVSLAVSDDGRQVASGSIDYSARIWSIADHEDGEAAFERSLRRAAVERVQSLFARLLLKEDVLAELRVDRSLSPRLREAALEVAGRRTENASRLYETAWQTVARPVGTAEENNQAVRLLRAACRITVEDPTRLADYRHALALALYRIGRLGEAMEVVDDLTRQGRDQPPWPSDLAVTAMAQHRLGHADEARRALERLDVLVRSGRWSGHQDAAGFLDEARQVLGHQG